MTASIVARLNLPRDDFTLDVDLRLPGRGISALFGQSGSGKTTCLRCLAGLERPITALAISNQRESVVAWDRASGEPLSPGRVSH